jgi:hypothetical protein
MKYHPDAYDVVFVQLACPLYCNVVAGRLGISFEDAAHVLVLMACSADIPLRSAVGKIRGLGPENLVPRISRRGKVRWQKATT